MKLLPISSIPSSRVISFNDPDVFVVARNALSPIFLTDPEITTFSSVSLG